MASGNPPHFRLEALSTGILLYRSEVQIVSLEQNNAEILLRLKITNTFKHVFDTQRLDGNVSHFYAHAHEVLVHFPPPAPRSVTVEENPTN